MSTLHSWKVLEPEGYYRSFIEKKERPDKREWMKARPVSLQTSTITTADGSATARLGNTSVVCGIKAEIAVPTLREPDKGFIVPNVELYSCCSPLVKAGPPGEKAMMTSQFLARIIDSSNMIDKKSLCVVPNKVAWCLYCDVVCLDYDGNLTDAAVLALVGALENTTLPKVAFDPDSNDISVEREKTEKVVLLNRPVSTTFTCYSSDIHLLDPTAEDESEGSGEVSLVLKDSNSLCLTHKTGGHVLTPETLDAFLEVSKNRANKLRKTLLSIKSR